MESFLWTCVRLIFSRFLEVGLGFLKFFIKDFFSKLTENFIFCAVLDNMRKNPQSDYLLFLISVERSISRKNSLHPGFELTLHRRSKNIFFVIVSFLWPHYSSVLNCCCCVCVYVCLVVVFLVFFVGGWGDGLRIWSHKRVT